MDDELKGAIDELMKKIGDADSSSSLETKLDQYLAMQVDADTARAETRKKFWKFLGATLGVLTVAASALLIYLKERPKPEDPAVQVTKKVEERVGAVETAIRGCPAKYDDAGNLLPCPGKDAKEALQGKVDINIQKIERLMQLGMDQRGLTLDSYEATRKALKAISRRADRVPDPPSLVKARTQQEKYEETKQDDLQEALDKGEPFAGIE